MKRFSFHKWFLDSAEKLIFLFPDWVTGESKIMKQKYYMKYGSRDYSQLIRQHKIHTMEAYLFIAVLFLIVGVSSFMEQLAEGKEINRISRPEFGTAEESVPVVAQMIYKDYTLSKDITLKVKQKELNEKEKLKLLEDYTEKLKDSILGENRNLNHINKPLNLIDRDPESGITVNWTSLQPELISDKGEVDLIAAKNNQNVELKADLSLDNVTVTEIYRLKIDRNAAKEDYERSMLGRLKESVDQFAEPDGTANIKLPEELEDGIKVRWITGKESNLLFYLFILIFAVLFVYFKRYDQINKEVREAEESVIKDLPEFINKLVLLLNAGLVVSTAFSKIVEDYNAFYQLNLLGKHKNNRYLYDELSEIQKKVNQSNASLIKELKEFSQRCGVRELVRLTAVISDNWNKGSMLAEKLEGEGELLWLNRKKRAEEKGKLAETKLTFPLMILLIVLIMVTIAPAMLEM